MSLFVLREGFQVVTTATGGSVTHVRTGDSLEMSPLEVQLLARASAGGIDQSDPTVRPVIRKLASLGLIVPFNPDAPAARAAPVEPVVPVPVAPMIELSAETEEVVVEFTEVAPETTVRAVSSADSTVPLLFGDLKIVRQGTSALYDVTNPTTGKSFPLYDFELSLARMLNGRRTYAEVVLAGSRLGIPVDVESLSQFVHQLERYGFVAPEGSAGPLDARDGDPWAKRDKWDEGIRTLFQSGIRMHRQGRYAEAVGYFEAILQQDPENAEAKEILAQLEKKGVAAPLADSDSIPTELVPAFAVQPPAPEAARVEAEPPPAPPAPAPARNDRRLAAGVAGAIALALAGGWLLGSHQSGGAVAPLAGADASAVVVVLTAPPDAAEVAPPIAAVEVPDATVALDSGSAAVAVAGPDAGSPVVIEAPAAGPSAGAPPAQAEQDRWIETRVGRRGRVTMGKLVAPSAGVVSWKGEAKSLVARGDVVAALQVGAAARTVAATAAGILLQAVEEGAAVKKAELLGSILFHEGFLQAEVEGARPEASWSCEVVDLASQQRAPCKVITVAPRAARFFVTATTEPLWFDTAADPRLRLAPAQ